MSLAMMLQAQKIDLQTSTISRLEWLAAELLRWNRRHNLTAIADLDAVYEKHLIDSLTLLPYVQRTKCLLDLGSGAGFPGLPLKIACPGLQVVAVDAVAKKIRFQSHVVRALKIEGYQAVHGRAEVLAGQREHREKYDIVTARALTSLVNLVTLAKPFLTESGRLLAMKGPEVELELKSCHQGLREEGWLIDCHDLTLESSRARRCLVEMCCNRVDS